MIAPTLLDHALAAALGLFGLYAILRGQPRMKEVTWDTPTKLAMYWSNGVVLWIAATLVGAVWIASGRPLADLGLTWHHEAPGVGTAIGLVLAAWFAVEGWRDVSTSARRIRMRERWERDTPFVPTTRREAAHFGFLALSAGVTEEVIARGFLILYIGAFTGPTPFGVGVAVTIPAVLFAIAHRYQGWRAGVRIVVLSIGLGAIFVVTGSLLIPIVFHALLDLAAGILTWRVAARLERDEASGAPGTTPGRTPSTSAVAS